MGHPPAEISALSRKISLKITNRQVTELLPQLYETRGFQYAQGGWDHAPHTPRPWRQAHSALARR